MARDDYANAISGIADVINAISDLAKPGEEELLRLSSELEMLRLEKSQELQYNLRSLDRKMEKESVIRERIQAKYPTLDSKHLTPGASEVFDDGVKMSESENDSKKQEIINLNNDISALNSLEQKLASQQVYFRGQEQAIAGETGLIDPGEFEKFVNEYRIKHPGEPVAGLYTAYDAGKVSTYEREKVKLEKQKISQLSAQTNWTSMRELATDDNFLDLLNDTTEDKELLSTFGQIIDHDSYLDFVKYTNADPTGKVKDLFYDLFPTQMWAMEGHVMSIDVLESEFLGKTKETKVAKVTENFLSSLSKVKSDKEAFILYDQEQVKLTNNADKIAMFAEMEKKLNKGNLKDSYTLHLSEGKDPKLPTKISLKEPVLKQYTGTPKEQAEKIFDTLDKITDPAVLERFDDLTWNFSISDPDRYSAGTAIFGTGAGGLVKTQSPYYEAYFSSLRGSLKQLVSEADPMGPDWLYYTSDSYFRQPDYLLPGLIESEYGIDIYKDAIEVADKVGREEQVQELMKVIESGKGDNYYDLLRILADIDNISKTWRNSIYNNSEDSANVPKPKTPDPNQVPPFTRPWDK